MKAVLERATQGEAAWVKAASRKATQERAAEVMAALEAALKRAAQTKAVLPDRLSLQSRNFLKEEEEEELPRASIFCSAGPGPKTKVKRFYNLEPSLTDADCLHGKLQPVAEPGGLLGVPTGAPANSSASTFADDPAGILGDNPAGAPSLPGPELQTQVSQATAGLQERV